MKTTFFKILSDIQFDKFQDQEDYEEYIQEYLEFLHSWGDWCTLENRIKYPGLSDYILCTNLWIVMRKLRHLHQHFVEPECVVLHLRDFLREHKVPMNQLVDRQYILGYLQGFSEKYGLDLFKDFEREDHNNDL